MRAKQYYNTPAVTSYSSRNSAAVRAVQKCSRGDLKALASKKMASLCGKTHTIRTT